MKAIPLAALAAISPVAAILGGEPVSPVKYPYLVSLYNTSEIIHPHPTCTGVLIQKNAILTAASCVHEIPARSGCAVIGPIGHSPSNKTHQIYAWDSFAYPGIYDYKTYKHNIAIITFTGDHNVTTFPKLAKRGKFHGSSVVRKVQMLGFGLGLTGEPGEEIHSLRQLELPIMDVEACRMQMDGRISVQDDKFCTEGCARRGLGSSFTGDTGAPVFYKDTLVGIASVGVENEINCYPRPVTRISQHQKFVQDYYRKSDFRKGH
ncbi:hypothetical protein QQS21_009190 [Conoideocrella luteorostrata]|uniref:Peptidase S1 domain-containing protein n=1 Tax=Conoideocrella luteorostrata TaxID=1105319 RepID=A0AAJ0FY05_9HYPO|nr:hypothetical protein QQS21_009190 [Conoideocrella luteorostrata]